MVMSRRSNGSFTSTPSIDTSAPPSRLHITPRIILQMTTDLTSVLSSTTLDGRDSLTLLTSSWRERRRSKVSSSQYSSRSSNNKLIFLADIFSCLSLCLSRRHEGRFGVCLLNIDTSNKRNSDECLPKIGQVLLSIALQKNLLLIRNSMLC